MQQNFLSPIGFRFTIKRLPNVEFYVQGTTLPGISMNPTTIATPFKAMRFAGDKLEHETFSVTIRLDEYMESYNEIFDWMVGLTKPDSFDQYKALERSDNGLYSDASLIILDSKGNPGIEVHFKDIFPVSLSSISFDVTQSDVNYATCEITFEHNGHTVSKM
jgi:hypothetical protein